VIYGVGGAGSIEQGIVIGGGLDNQVLTIRFIIVGSWNPAK